MCRWTRIGVENGRASDSGVKEWRDGLRGRKLIKIGHPICRRCRSTCHQCRLDAVSSAPRPCTVPHPLTASLHLPRRPLQPLPSTAVIPVPCSRPRSLQPSPFPAAVPVPCSRPRPLQLLPSPVVIAVPCSHSRPCSHCRPLQLLPSPSLQ